ncbi:MAG: PUA domain-containing protein [Promethearchaeia archaeon]
MSLRKNLDFRKVKGISDYQFGVDITDILFATEEDISFKHSKNTDKLKYVYKQDKFFLSLRPTNGYLTLSFPAAQKILDKTSKPRMRVIVLNEISEYIREGRNVFCKHVVDLDERLRPMDETIVVNEDDDLLAIGRLTQSTDSVRAFTRGVGVNVRKGNH